TTGGLPDFLGPMRLICERRRPSALTRRPVPKGGERREPESAPGAEQDASRAAHWHFAALVWTYTLDACHRSSAVGNLAMTLRSESKYARLGLVFRIFPVLISLP